MATEQGLITLSFAASGDHSAKQYYGVKLHTTVDQIAIAGSEEEGIGILQNKPAAAGRGAEVGVLGKSKAVTDGNSANIAIADKLNTDSAGKFVKEATDNKYVFARAMAASTADGAVIPVLLTGGFFVGA